MSPGGGANDSPPPSLLPPHPTNSDGEYLLRLLQNHRQHHQQQQPPFFNNTSSSSSSSSNNLSLDPAVAAVGPSIPIPLSSHHHPHHQRSPNFSVSPQNPNFFLRQGFSQNTPTPPQSHSFFTAPHQHFDLDLFQPSPEKDNLLFGSVSATTISQHDKLSLLELELKHKERELGFGRGTRTRNGFDPNRSIDHRVSWAHGSPPGRPPGFAAKGGVQRPGRSELGNLWRDVSSSSTSELNNYDGFSSSDKDYERDRRVLSRERDGNGVGVGVGIGIGLGGQLDRPGFPTGSAFRSSDDVENKRSLLDLNVQDHVVGDGVSHDEIDDLSEQLVDSVLEENESNEKNDISSVKKKHTRDKDFRSDARGKWILSQRMRNSRRLIECRRDIDSMNANLLAIYNSLIPEDGEKAKQKQLLTLLESLVSKEWPNARLYVYGSCANSFGVSKSDIDICLALDQDIDKSEVLLKLADILQSDNLQNVQALTRARVPIVKLMDPGTGISCDICINNVLAVVNTKLLRDYAEIDVRLRQLAFLVKHWAKSRGVNETYQGTLSSYAYVLMCIHFLQQRNPPILPCLQGMEATYKVSVDDTKCAFFDQVERLRGFGARNEESIAQLLWGFFNYWAYSHDYANSVVSIRTGRILSKQEKDWTRRIGNDRHLICIEDPFETSHDLGRVVDKHSIRVLREEFERAAEIMQYDPNPCITLFQPYVPT